MEKREFPAQSDTKIDLDDDFIDDFICFECKTGMLGNVCRKKGIKKAHLQVTFFL